MLNRDDAELGKFRQKDNKVSVSVTADEALPTKDAEAIAWDEVVTTFPSASSDLFTYKNNGVVVLTVLVTYTDSTKKNILSLKKTRY